MLFGAIFIAAEENLSDSFRQCVSNWDENHAKSQPDEYRFVIVKIVSGHALCVVKAFDKHNGIFAALAAFIIAWFTYTLDLSTSRLWRTEERNFQTAQRAFVFLDGFNVELTTATDSKTVTAEMLPQWYRSDPGLYITRFAALPKWRNAGKYTD